MLSIARTRNAEHRRVCRLEQSEQSAFADHLLANDDHVLNSVETKTLSFMLHYYLRLHREATEIRTVARRLPNSPEHAR